MEERKNLPENPDESVKIPRDDGTPMDDNNLGQVSGGIIPPIPKRPEQDSPL